MAKKKAAKKKELWYQGLKDLWNASWDCVARGFYKMGDWSCEKTYWE